MLLVTMQGLVWGEPELVHEYVENIIEPGLTFLPLPLFVDFNFGWLSFIFRLASCGSASRPVLYF